jgi:membrane protein DedA with SNARE-associated domain
LGNIVRVDPQTAIVFLENWGYPALALLLGATGFGSPIPEDLLLVAAGYLISADVFSWRVTLPLAYLGVTGSDCILYWIGTQVRSHSQAWLKRFVRPSRLALATGWLRHGHVVVFIARLVPGTRAVTFIAAGVHGIPFRRFLLFDAIGAAVWVPLLLFAGAQLGEEIGGIERLFVRVSKALWWLVVAAVLLVIAWRFFRTEESKL